MEATFSGVRGEWRPGQAALERRMALPIILIAVLEVGFVFDGGEGLQHWLAEVGESDGGGLRDAALGESGKDFAENVVDVCGGEEVAGKGGAELYAKSMRFQELEFFAGVEGAEGGMVFVAEHAALAAVGEGKLAEERLVRGDSGTG